MCFNYALLAELAERKRKLQVKEIRSYDDAVVRRNRKFVTLKVLNPPLGTCSSKFRSVGINTNQELLTCPSLPNEAQKKKMIRLTSEDESVKLMEITVNSSKHSGFDSMSPSCEETINVQDILDRHNLLSNPLRPVYGTESIVHRRKIS